MIISSEVIVINYAPATDILSAGLPDIRQFALEEVRHCLGLIVESVRQYEVRNLLLDASKSVVEVGEEAHRTLLIDFCLELQGSPLERVARVATPDPGREERSARLSAELIQELEPALAFGSFATEEEAMAWLLS
ncbi:hypothetical protein GCM10023188_44280 [Pontibacter saemangeumensis]|uniref:SpoIIAA-like n=2 Tax=Pontibacter saemangeumensis TaxID=1084525 RepID=A0ABP8M2Q5_9BACT